MQSGPECFNGESPFRFLTVIFTFNKKYYYPTAPSVGHVILRLQRGQMSQQYIILPMIKSVYLYKTFPSFLNALIASLLLFIYFSIPTFHRHYVN